jgi:hypothetical protein
VLCLASGFSAAAALLGSACSPSAAVQLSAVVPAGSTTADWITAVGTAFAAVGTVGAVVIALWQTRRRYRYDIHVTCGSGITGDPDIGDLVTLTAVNLGERMAKLTMAYLRIDTGGQIVAPFFIPGLGLQISVVASMENCDLPKTLTPGESVQVQWRRPILESLREREGFTNYLYGFFTDQLGNVYSAPFPGMRAKRGGKLWRETRYVPIKVRDIESTHRRDRLDDPSRSGADAF